MKRTLIAVAALCLGLPLTGTAQSNMQIANVSTPLNARQLHSLIKNAHSTAGYKQLAGYYHQQEAEYRAKAADEKSKRDQMVQGASGQYHKIPTPADFAQSVYESYESKADKAALQARHYDQLAGAPTEQNPQTATNSQGKS